MKKLLLVALACVWAGPVVVAQTGRIAHFSHGGSVEALVMLTKDGDNLGTPPQKITEWKRDTLVYLNDTTVMHSGQRRTGYSYSIEKYEWHRAQDKFVYPCRAKSVTGLNMLDYLRHHYPNATFIGFGKSKKVGKVKDADHVPSFRKRPFQYSYWRELTGAVAVGAAGWLLGKKRPA